jgi:deazaflavin-dependent oxidoreductase (nitroreductase family)
VTRTVGCHDPLPRSVFSVTSPIQRLELEHHVTTSKSAPGPASAPGFVLRTNPLVLRALRLGLPMGPNVLMTVRGRKTGQPRTFPVAILKTGGREYLFSAFGEVSWVHNLRADGAATIHHGRRSRMVTATELAPPEAAVVLEGGLRSIMRVPVIGSMIAGWYGINRHSTIEDYLAAAARHPAFELHEAHSLPGP